MASLIIGGFVLYLTSCSKESADKLSGASTCDTANVSYSTRIVSILQDNCYSCHGGATPPTGIRLDTYANLKVFVDNGFFVSAVDHDGTVTPMPYGQPKLPTCEVNTILAWVHQGAKNN